MPKLIVVSRDGSEKEVEAQSGLSVMEIIRDAGFDELLALCGGCCSCATCHVYVEGDWFEKVGPPDDIEFAMLDMVADVMKDNSRLGCQILMSDKLDGLVVALPGAKAPLEE